MLVKCANNLTRTVLSFNITENIRNVYRGSVLLIEVEK